MIRRLSQLVVVVLFLIGLATVVYCGGAGVKALYEGKVSMEYFTPYFQK